MSELHVPLTTSLRNYLAGGDAPEPVMLAAEIADLCRATLACDCEEDSAEAHREVVRATVALAVEEPVIAEMIIALLLHVAVQADRIIEKGAQDFEMIPPEVQSLLRGR